MLAARNQYPASVQSEEYLVSSNQTNPMHYIRYYIPLLLLIVSSSFRTAVIREDFARMVDYAGWQLVDAYMQDYVRLRPDMAAEKEGFELFQETYNSTNYNQQSPPNNEAVRLYLISHNWRTAGINLYAAFVNNKAAYQNDWSDQRAAEFLQQKIAAVSPEKLGAQSDADYRELQATKARLQREVAEAFGVSSPTPAPQASQADTPVANAAGEGGISEALDTPASEVLSDDTSFTASADTNRPVAEEETQKGFQLPTTAAEEPSPGLLGILDAGTNPVLLGAVVLLLLLLIYLFSLYKRLDNRIDKHSKRIEDLTTRLFLRKDPLSADEVQRLRDQVAALQKQVEEQTTSPPTPAPVTKAKQPRPTRPRLVEDDEEYYLSTPNSDGTFNTSSMSQLFRPSASVYKFRVTESNGTEWAEFTVANDYDAVKDALSSPGSYLDPVCESENTFFPDAKKIKNVKPGRAMKQGDKWVVKPEHKARIRYE